MRSVDDLHVVQFRDEMLYAQRHPGRLAPLALGLGLAACVGAVHGALNALPTSLAILLALAGIGFFALVPHALLSGAWLSIDRQRGWVHWRRRRWQKVAHESFSPQRIETLRVAHRNFKVPGVGLWEVLLHVDHPRLGTVRLGWTLRRKAAHRIARGLAASLELNWIDEMELLHVALPAVEKAADSARHHGRDWLANLPPPPEILVERQAGRARFVMPNLEGLSAGNASFLFYAVIWCLWAWSSLVIELHLFGPYGDWSRANCWTIVLVGTGSIFGLLMLAQACLLTLGEQILESTDQGWLLTQRWLGLEWEKRRLEWKKQGWLRRVDPPGEESGLWIPDRRHEIRLAPGLSAEALAWLQQLLKQAG